MTLLPYLLGELFLACTLVIVQTMHMCINCVSGLPTGIYTTSKPDACQFVANNCSANIICVEDEKQLAKILEVSECGISV